MKKILKITALLTFILFLTNSCEDEPPNDYIPQNFVEGFLYVGQPVEGIVVMKSQPVTQTFDYDSSLVEDAFVKVIENGDTEYILEFRSEFPQGYYLPDTNIKVKPNTEYDLVVNLPDGTEITGSTTTPGDISWINPPKDTIYFPRGQDSLELPEVDSLQISWTPVEDVNWYMIRIKALDTLEYGKYLDNVPDDQKNRRVYNPFADEEDRFYYETVVWAGPLPNTRTSTVWRTFKWFGRNEAAVYALDSNFLRWMFQYQRSSYYESFLSTVSGGIGVFGSASVVRKEVFLIKNQP